MLLRPVTVPFGDHGTITTYHHRVMIDTQSRSTFGPYDREPRRNRKYGIAAALNLYRW